jgi:hypothetical protein
MLGPVPADGGGPVLLLDTAGVPLNERVGAFRAAFDQASVPCRVE